MNYLERERERERERGVRVNYLRLCCVSL